MTATGVPQFEVATASTGTLEPTATMQPVPVETMAPPELERESEPEPVG